jgi:predicted anti-sigma-YlaC factor YlaD
MQCQRCRDALSACLDAEDDPVERAVAEQHLAGCGDCRRWLEGAAAVTRLARVGIARPAPGVPDSVLDAVPPRSRRWLPAVLRLALGLVGALQSMLGVAQAVAAAGVAIGTVRMFQGAAPEDLVHESAACNVAVGAGFLFVAWRRTRPSAVVPILSAFVAVLCLVSVDDLVDGWVRSQRLVSHLLLLIGYVIVLVLAHPQMGPDIPPVRPQNHRTGPVGPTPSRRWPVQAAKRDHVAQATDGHRVTWDRRNRAPGKAFVPDSSAHRRRREAPDGDVL